MRRHLRQNLMLGSGAALLALLTWLVVKQEQTASATPLTTIETSRVQALSVRNGNQPLRRFERRDSGWQMREPFDMPAQAQAIERLLAIVSAPPRSLHEAGKFDPRKIGLQPPQAILDLDGQAIEFGGTDAIRGDRYVRVGGTIALVPDRFSAWLLAPPEAEVERRLMAPLQQLATVQINGKIHNELIAAWSAVATSQVKGGGETAPADAIAVQLDGAGGHIDYRLWRRDDGRYSALRMQPPLLYPLEEAQVQQLLPAAPER